MKGDRTKKSTTGPSSATSSSASNAAYMAKTQDNSAMIKKLVQQQQDMGEQLNAIGVMCKSIFRIVKNLEKKNIDQHKVN